MNILQKLFGGGTTVDLQQVINDGAYLVDVRTSGEFSMGHVKGSVNIPLDIIASKTAQLKNKKTIVVFCQSGGRSSAAKSILEKNGFTNVVNGGSWMQVRNYVK
ncbi:MAG: rhodanese-like domain-containing protein [Ferruginibacter sp.]